MKTAEALPAGGGRPLVTTGWRAGLPGVLSAVVLAALACCLGWRQIYSPDMGWHLAVGRWIAEHGWAMRVDQLTHTVSGQPYFEFDWIRDLAIWWIFRYWGECGLVAHNLALTLLAWGLLWFRAARKGTVPMAVLSALLLPIVLVEDWEIRAHVVSWICMSLMLFAFEARERGDARWLPLLPAVMLAWVNLHQVYVLGIVLIVLHAGLDLWSRRRVDRPLWIWGGLGLAACLLNPYGISAFTYPFELWSLLGGDSIFKSETVGTTEFLSPFSAVAHRADAAGRVPLTMMLSNGWFMAVLIIHGYNHKRVTLREWIILIVFGLFYMKAAKNFGFFHVATFPTAAALLSENIGRLTMRAPWLGGGRICRIVAVAVLLISAGAWLEWRSGYLYATSGSGMRKGCGFNEFSLPVRSSRFVRENRLEGRLLNAFGDGGFISLDARLPVFIDGRSLLFGEAFYRKYVGAGDPAALARLVDDWGITLAVFPYAQKPTWLYHFSRDPGWRCVYHDDRDVIFLKRGHREDLPGLETGAATAKGTVGRERIDAALQRAAAPRTGLLARMTGRHYRAMRELNLSAFRFALGDAGGAIEAAVSGLERSTVREPDLLINLGHALFEQGDYGRAATSLELGLRHRTDSHALRALHQAQRLRSEQGNRS